MKSTKFLAILAGTALFAACSQEELVENNNTPQQMDEVVGAKLVGTDLSMNVSMSGFSANSRYAGGNKGWENEDVVGLGWILNTENPSADQKENVAPITSSLYANHMFETEDNGAIWTSKGNVYEGWYFAYYPWTYDKKIGKIKKYEMNPAMVNRGANYHYSQSLYLSNSQFVSADDIMEETNSLSKKFELYQAVKFIQITAKAEKESTFAKGGELSTLPIDSITISTGDKKIFANQVNVYAKNLPAFIEYSEDVEKPVVDMQNLAAFRKAYGDVVVASAKVAEIGRNVEAANISVSTNPTEEGKNVNMYLNVVPTTATLTADDITVKFHSGSASFVINKAKGLSDVNKTAFDALVEAYKAGGALSTINELDEEGNPKATLAHLPLTFELCAADFVTDFSSITDITEWNEAVELVSLLKREQETFYIDGNIEFDGAINMPEGCELTVIPVDNEDVDETEILTDNMITLKGTFENGIPANLNIEAVDVVVEGTVEEAQTINAHCITNNGTLNLGKGTSVDAQKELAVKVTNYSVINMAEYSMLTNVDNKNRINIVYKSAIKLAQNGENGEVAYEVTNLDTPTRIQNVLNTVNNNTGRHAQVNVLVFNSANEISEFDFTYNKSTEADDDYYNSTPGSSDDLTYEGLENVSLEINGVNVSSTKEVTVKNVEINNANLGAGIVVGGDLTVKGGNVVADVAKVEGAMTIEAGQGVITAATIGSVDIKSGNFTVNAQTIEGNVTATGENYFNVKNFNGTVTLTNTSDINYINIDGATFSEDVILEGNFGLVNITLPKNLTVKGGFVKMDNVNINGTLTNDGNITISGNDDIVIKKIINNKELSTSTTIYVEEIILKKEVSKTNVQESPEKIIYYSENYGQGGTTTGKILPNTITVVGDEWQIKDAEGLKAFAALVNAGTSFEGKTFKLMSDINLENTQWPGIGEGNSYFNGVFDGNGKTISNLFIENETRDGIGFISKAKGTKANPVVLKNLTLNNVTLKGRNDVGALLGSTSNYVSISNINLTGDVKIEGTMNVGGLVGETCKTISNINVNVNEGSYVKSSYGPVGGVAGLLVENYHANSITSNINVFATFNADINYTNNNGAGGIFGCANGYNTKIENCTSTGNVTVENNGNETLKNRIGGIAGRVAGGKITFTNCSYTGTLKNTYKGTEITEFPNNSLVGETTATITFN